MPSLETWGPDDAATYPTILVTTQSGAMHVIRAREMTSTRSYVADPVVEQVASERDGHIYVDLEGPLRVLPGAVVPLEGAALQRLRRDGEALRLHRIPRLEVGQRARLILASLSSHPESLGTERLTTPVTSLTVLEEGD